MGKLSSGIIKIFHQITDLVLQNKDQEHKQIALSCQQEKKKKKSHSPAFMSLHMHTFGSQCPFTGTQFTSFLEVIIVPDPLLVKSVRK